LDLVQGDGGVRPVDDLDAELQLISELGRASVAGAGYRLGAGW
jgi:hypothetical protein